ncbi:MAG: PocR ligand-binding domain-containing protein [Oscillospiraceae bacterium]|nr:PocR ligand-binding domain-containing protein [Oscillospiraceae bacterium]
MFIDCDIEKLKRTFIDFSNATGIVINFVDTSLSHSTFHTISHNNYCKTINNIPNGERCCTTCDSTLLLKCSKSKKLEMHICHAGLVDAAVPIYHHEMLLGYIILGQMKTDPDFSKVKDYIKKFDLDPEKMEEYYKELPLYCDEAVASIANIAVMLTKYILLENMLKPSFDKNIEVAINFINENLHNHLTIQYISKQINVSKTVLYKTFRNHFNCTVNEYINSRRIEKSAELLLTTDLSVESISQKIGFSGAAYYSKLFKKQKGISPLKFRNLSGIK